MKVQNDPIKAMNEKLRKQIDAKENEIENVNKMYEKRVEAANSNWEDRYVETLDRNNQRIAVANKEYEDKLQSYKDSLEEAKNKIHLEEAKNVEIAKERQDNLKEQSEAKFSKIYENARENEESLIRKSQNDAKELDQKSRFEKSVHEGRAGQELSSFSSALTLNTREKQDNLKKQLETETQAMSRTLVQNKMESQNRLHESAKKNQRIENDQRRVQEDQLKFLDQYQDALIRQKQEDFKVRYERMASEYQEVLSTLKAKLDKTTQEAIEANMKEKKSITDASDDPFYQLEILKPTMSEDSKNYYVRLEVPPHEKENVHLMANGREIRVTMSKKYSASFEDRDGSLNRTSKTQLYSKEFPTKDIMNPKQVSQKYEDGILSFKIAKL